MLDVSSTTSRRSRADWEQLMAEYETGELTQRVFCERHDVAYSSFGYWRKRLRQSSAQTTSTDGFVELPMASSPANYDWHVELDLGEGRVLRIR